ncbi:MAG: PorP/SprF family type IX secretion system membrane protein [Bacteroidales bacterium]|jgi:type IX secretion system PorP/SprF family membrane protein|nr:PorP/SprF family type IX secretion system membrane protein [Bacteroidales bacterium]MDD2204566.1 PorP/SprF family type IX secretion system membrane protein [Bacteroidales bacterium]MDD3913507.1 PorP/SprF family type IX secretion system membrane protein [Bacteroidales bacterium]MDD4633996.1 PorP/SprF family type IX secretion system membrane protein [Bacteroidales bacterium]
MKKSVSVGILMFSCFFMKAQDPAFSQFYACPVYINPALTGNVEGARVGINYRNQWPGISAFNTYSITYEQNISSINSGVGIQVMGYQSDAIINNYYAMASYSYDLQVARDFNIRAGIAGGVKMNTLNANNIVLPDGTSGTTSEGIESYNDIVSDFALGLYCSYSNMVYGGFSASHVTMPREGVYFYGDDGLEQSSDRLAIKYICHAGGIIPLDRSGDFYISPNVLFQKQSEYNQINIGVYSCMKLLTVGLWYKSNIWFNNTNTHVICGLVGVTYNNFSVGYSYDFNFMGIGTSSHGAHEISVAIKFSTNGYQQKRVIGAIKSPMF